MHGIVYDRYIIPFLLGDTAFLNTFTKKDQEKFLRFLQDNLLLGTGKHHYYRVRSSGRRSKSSGRRSSGRVGGVGGVGVGGVVVII